MQAADQVITVVWYWTCQEITALNVIFTYEMNIGHFSTSGWHKQALNRNSQEVETFFQLSIFEYNQFEMRNMSKVGGYVMICHCHSMTHCHEEKEV